MKKILIFINSLGGGGAEKVLINFLSSINSAEYSITLVSTKGGVYEKQVPKYINYRKIIKTNCKLLEFFLSKCLNCLPKKLFLKFFLNDEVDLKIAYLEGTPTNIIGAEKKCKKIAFVHCDVSVNNLILPFYRNNKQCLNEYKQFDKICFVSESAKEGFFKSVGYLENALVLHNVVDLNSIKKMSSEEVELEYQTSGVKFVTVGRLSKEKGFSRLLDIVSELEAKYSFELWILGEGDERSNLEKIIEQKNIRSVKLLGFVSNPYPYMKKADMFICSSYFEGYSTAVNESLILGVPVITTDCAGMNEITENGKYGIITDNDANSLFFGIESVLNFPSLIIELKEMLKKRSQKTNIEEYELLLKKLFN